MTTTIDTTAYTKTYNLKEISLIKKKQLYADIGIQNFLDFGIQIQSKKSKNPKTKSKSKKPKNAKLLDFLDSKIF